MTASALRRVRLLAGALAIIALPGASWLEGSRQFAWTMFSLTGSYRLELSAIDAAGIRRPLAPTELAAAAGGPASAHLSGAEAWRYHDVGRVTLGRHLFDVGKLGCAVAAAHSPRPIAVEVRFDERADLDAPIRSRALTVDCGPGGG